MGTFPTTLRGAFPKIKGEEGLNGFYKSLVPLWGRQIPYTMMKFACFERTVEALYQYVVPKPRAECSKSEQLVVTFAAGYIAAGCSEHDLKRHPPRTAYAGFGADGVYGQLCAVSWCRW